MPPAADPSANDHTGQPGHAAEPNLNGLNVDAPDRDRNLADLLVYMTDELRAGRWVDIECLGEQHPDLSNELRELWAAVQVAEGVAAHLSQHVGSSQEVTVGLPPDEGRLPSVGDLPRQFGDFDLLEELGRGGMGIVYKARQRSLDRIVAVKMILRGELASPADVARFRSEAAAAARLEHAHIVPVYEVGECDGQPYFVMKYVEGTTLARRLAEGPLPPQEAAELLMPVCLAIQFAHAHGILHRDLKPSNILIDREDRAHVTDFGLAKQVTADGALTRSGAVLGTPSYMAPEQAAGNRGQLGPASDVYSLGTILYQMLTGRPPFQAASPVDTVLLVLEQDPLPPRLVNPKADPDLEMIALRCLQKPPLLRYPTAQSLADDLAAYLHDEPISARSGRFTQVVARWFRETHHATVLENWGLLWMWHSLVLFVICAITNFFQWQGITSVTPYLALWTAGLGTWAGIFWALRRRAGPVTFVERQIAHVWAGSVVSISVLFLVEKMLGLPVLTLSPVLAIASGMVFISKAGILTGAFYLQAAALFATALVMAWMDRNGVRLSITLFGIVSGLCFFFPGLKYYRQRAGKLPIPLAEGWGERRT
ncbi:MAG TPA: serine/threonine-protein kinase [Pirellulales bacterium]|nr:serine/threonine-protein kinase [Pirellulales bacterium]